MKFAVVGLLVFILSLAIIANAESGSVSYRSTQSLTIAMLERNTSTIEKRINENTRKLNALVSGAGYQGYSWDDVKDQAEELDQAIEKDRDQLQSIRDLLQRYQPN